MRLTNRIPTNAPTFRPAASKRDHPADTFVAAHVWQFDFRYRVAVWSGCGAGFGV
jgi:hypothetical protein